MILRPPQLVGGQLQEGEAVVGEDGPVGLEAVAGQPGEITKLEKKEEREEKEENYLYSERSYGTFERRLEVPAGADAGRIKAQVRKGVLQIILPKSATATTNKRRIAIDAK